MRIGFVDEMGAPLEPRQSTRCRSAALAGVLFAIIVAAIRNGGDQGWLTG
jgi:hypothetical protein